MRVVNLLFGARKWDTVQYDEVLVKRFSYIPLYTIPEHQTVTVNIKHLICDNDIGKFTRYICTISALFGARKW